MGKNVSYHKKRIVPKKTLAEVRLSCCYKQANESPAQTDWRGFLLMIFNGLLFCLYFFGLLVAVVNHILTIGLHTVVIFARTNDNLFKLTQTCTSRYQVTADNILFHTIEGIYLTTDGSLVEYLGGFLERCWAALVIP